MRLVNQHTQTTAYQVHRTTTQLIRAGHPQSRVVAPVNNTLCKVSRVDTARKEASESCFNIKDQFALIRNLKRLFLQTVQTE